MGPIINTDAPGPIVRQCTGTSRRTGKRCTRSAMKGQSVCYTHGGAAKQNRRAAARRLALGEARAELTRMGVPIEVDPAEAMLEMVCEAAGNVAFLRGRVADLRPDLGTDGLAGNIGSTAKENEAAPHVWVAMYDAERERLVKWAKACRDSGVDERRVQVAEQQGRQLATVLTTSFDALLVALTEQFPREKLEAVWRAVLPGIVRGAIEAVNVAGDA